MLSECLHYQGKADYFLMEFLKWYFSKYWQVRNRPVFARTVTFYLLLYLTILKSDELKRFHQYCQNKNPIGSNYQLP